MPVYSLTSHHKIPDIEKRQLVDFVTDAHCSTMIAPEQFVHVLFSDGIPIAGRKALYIHANVRAGRTDKTIDSLCDTLIRECARILNVPKEKIHINLLELNAKWAMEGGYVMPDPGEEDEWMDKVTRALTARSAAE